MASLAEMAKAQAPRTFEIGAPMTIEEIYGKMQERAAAFEFPFELKKGIGGQTVTFQKNKIVDVIISVSVKEATVKVTPIIQENKTSVGIGGFSARVDKNSVMQKGVKGVLDIPMQRGAYTDEVTETIKKILAGEEVADFVHPEPVVEEAPAAAPLQPTKSWTVTLILNLLLGGAGFHRFYVGKVGSGILFLFTGGLFGIGWIVDFIKILTGKFTDKNGQPLKK